MLIHQAVTLEEEEEEKKKIQSNAMLNLFQTVCSCINLFSNDLLLFIRDSLGIKYYLNYWEFISNININLFL